MSGWNYVNRKKRNRGSRVSDMLDTPPQKKQKKRRRKKQSNANKTGILLASYSSYSDDNADESSSSSSGHVGGSTIFAQFQSLQESKDRDKTSKKKKKGKRKGRSVAGDMEAGDAARAVATSRSVCSVAEAFRSSKKVRQGITRAGARFERTYETVLPRIQDMAAHLEKVLDCSAPWRGKALMRHRSDGMSLASFTKCTAAPYCDTPEQVFTAVVNWVRSQGLDMDGLAGAFAWCADTLMQDVPASRNTAKPLSGNGLRLLIQTLVVVADGADIMSCKPGLAKLAARGKFELDGPSRPLMLDLVWLAAQPLVFGHPTAMLSVWGNVFAPSILRRDTRKWSKPWLEIVEVVTSCVSEAMEAAAPADCVGGIWCGPHLLPLVTEELARESPHPMAHLLHTCVSPALLVARVKDNLTPIDIGGAAFALCMAPEAAATAFGAPSPALVGVLMCLAAAINGVAGPGPSRAHAGLTLTAHPDALGTAVMELVAAVDALKDTRKRRQKVALSSDDSREAWEAARDTLTGHFETTEAELSLAGQVLRTLTAGLVLVGTLGATAYVLARDHPEHPWVAPILPYAAPLAPLAEQVSAYAQQALETVRGVSSQ